MLYIFYQVKLGDSIWVACTPKLMLRFSVSLSVSSCQHHLSLLSWFYCMDVFIRELIFIKFCCGNLFGWFGVYFSWFCGEILVVNTKYCDFVVWLYLCIWSTPCPTCAWDKIVSSQKENKKFPAPFSSGDLNVSPYACQNDCSICPKKKCSILS